MTRWETRGPAERGRRGEERREEAQERSSAPVTSHGISAAITDGSDGTTAVRSFQRGVEADEPMTQPGRSSTSAGIRLMSLQNLQDESFLGSFKLKVVVKSSAAGFYTSN